ncbi:NAD-dependent epimerase/dehydratase family protein [Neorhizobium sp. P12A]|uniref:NAD-dependent epimerase/dehydratase family protein n=1 Tax=Rhizobium/Agrobacterium group TaxID=227290 RepID=UPI0010486938|nr:MULTISPECIES: NAD-dependent epimerase/dehydratase family protein [Rhizobium/Agrobacterium group]KAA0698318.1 NAD-dependent epimerase/dehydratase family protein [Neorhizobium sp. P12A]TCR92911.1 nucleoside-diphosphate-sugar epimerase [Rhizobium sp. BK376]
MKIFLTGASGYIGGSVGAALVAKGHTVRGLVRDQAKAADVVRTGIEPVIGTLDDTSLLTEEARAADAVINTASSDHRGAVEAILRGIEGSGKAFLHTSGSSIVGDEAMGEPSDSIYDEDAKIEPEPDKVARVAIDQLVLGASGVRSVVLCNTMIYGNTLGTPAESVQVPRLARNARETGKARYIGRGLNRWSNVHIADVVDLYLLALDSAKPGTFLYVESGEEELGNVVRAVADRLELGEAGSMSADEAIATWGREMAVFGLGSNSRVRGHIATRDLGWKPKTTSITEWIRSEMPR